MDAFLVLIQTGREGDWADRGLPEVVSGRGRPGQLHAAVLDWLADHHGGSIGPDWRALAWELSDRPYDPRRPDEVITAEEMQARRVTSPRGRSRPAPRVRGGHGQVALKTPAGEDLLGRTVLITRDPGNNSALGATGPWFPADRPGPDTAAARVTQVALADRGNRMEVRLVTPVGEIGWMRLGHGVILVDD